MVEEKKKPQLEVEISKIIKKDKTEVIESLIKEKKCKETSIRIIYIFQAILMIISTLLIFISSSLDEKKQHETRILSITGGGLNILVISIAKIIDTFNKNIAEIIGKINKKLNYIASPYYEDI